MTNNEIKIKIDENNAEIENLINPAQFTLNKIVTNLLNENTKLRHQCTHEFKDGKCIYCYTEEIK